MFCQCLYVLQGWLYFESLDIRKVLLQRHYLFPVLLSYLDDVLCDLLQTLLGVACLCRSFTYFYWFLHLNEFKLYVKGFCWSLDLKVSSLKSEFTVVVVVLGGEYF